MACPGSTDIFNDGWRDPGDDCERLMHYVVFALGTLAGLGTLGYGLYEMIGGAHPPQRLLGLLFAIFGALFSAIGVGLFVSEAKHWDLRHLTAERMVAGGFLFGFALMLMGGQIATRTGSVGHHIHSHDARSLEGGMEVGVWLIGGGIADLILFLLIGLLYAYAPQIRPRRRIAGIRVERRFAIDEKLNEIDDHPCPTADGLTPAVTLRFRDGRLQTLVSTETAYELAVLGRLGTAVVRGRRLERFHLG